MPHDNPNDPNNPYNPLRRDTRVGAPHTRTGDVVGGVEDGAAERYFDDMPGMSDEDAERLAPPGSARRMLPPRRVK